MFAAFLRRGRSLAASVPPRVPRGFLSSGSVAFANAETVEQLWKKRTKGLRRRPLSPPPNRRKRGGASGGKSVKSKSGGGGGWGRDKDPGDG